MSCVLQREPILGWWRVPESQREDPVDVEAKALVARLIQSDAEADRARALAQARLIEAYEKTRCPRTRPALRDLLAYLMDQHGLTRADLIPILGTASRVSEVLGGKRELSMTMIKRLRDGFMSPPIYSSRPRASAQRRSTDVCLRVKVLDGHCGSDR